MTNLEKIKNIEISGYKIFERFNIDDLDILLKKYGCGFCPMDKECDDGSGIPCHTLLSNWLEMKEESKVLMTNNDQIKSMSDKEMGEFIYDIMTEEGSFCWKCPVPSPLCREIIKKNKYENDEENNYCLSIIIEWLGSEVDRPLKPCPICGGNVKFNKDIEAIECENCGLRMYGEYSEELTKRWNIRKGGK